jgi:hypothetical protein
MDRASELPQELVGALISVARGALGRNDIEYEKILVCQRFTTGHQQTVADDTLYMILTATESNERWVPTLDEILTENERLGFGGRVEMIDQRAVGGLPSFAPNVSTALQQAWPNIQQQVIDRLYSFNVDWRMVDLLNRGYWEQVSICTVSINASQPALLSPVRAAIQRDLDRCGYGLSVEIQGTEGMWGVFDSDKPAVQPIPPSTLFGWR